ncbi:MAG: hypothetical protein ACKO7D_02670 [Bacteroidota bacterium]
MKSIFFSFLFSALALTSYSQENVIIGKSQTVSELAQSKNNGVYTFYFPTSITKDKIETAANYYPTYFSYSINEEENSIKITLLENSANTRKIIMRFLMSARLQKIKVGETELFIQDFYQTYLN